MQLTHLKPHATKPKNYPTLHPHFPRTTTRDQSEKEQNSSSQGPAAELAL